MNTKEIRLDGEYRYKGIIVNVRRDHAELSNGAIVEREVVEHPGGVAVLPVDTEGNCYMVRQYRYPFSRELLEAPAGKLEPCEDPLEAAVRELSEETGFSADEWIYLGEAFASPGYLGEVIHLFLALGLHPGNSHLDVNEILNVEKHSLSELVEMAMNNELKDSKTVLAVFKAEKILSERPEYIV